MSVFVDEERNLSNGYETIDGALSKMVQTKSID